MNKPERILLYLWMAGVALATLFFIRPSAYKPAEPLAFDKTQKRLNAFYVGVMSYHVDYASFPQGRTAQGTPTQLTTPVSYMKQLHADPYSVENREKVAKLDVTGQEAMGRVRTLYVLALLFGLALVFLGVLPLRPWGLEQIALLWVVFCLPILTLALLSGKGPVFLGTASLLMFFAGPWALFLSRRLTFDALLMFALSVLVVVIALHKENRALLWVSVGLIGAAGIRVAAASGSLGRMWLDGWHKHRVSLALQVEICALSLTVVAGLTSILLADWVLEEKTHVKEIETAGSPFNFASFGDFFVASSNGPDFRPSWRRSEVGNLLKVHGANEAERYLRAHTYDPSNGSGSPGDFMVFARQPHPPVIQEPLPKKTRPQLAAAKKEGAEARP